MKTTEIKEAVKDLQYLCTEPEDQELVQLFEDVSTELDNLNQSINSTYNDFRLIINTLKADNNKLNQDIMAEVEAFLNNLDNEED